MPNEKICPHCERTFYPSRSNQRFCGPSCQQRTWVARNPKEEREFACPSCGTQVTTKDPRKKYCTPQCNWRAQNKKRPRRTLEKKPCAGCGEEFRPPHFNTIYCSTKCRNQKHYRESRAALSSRHWEYRKSKKWGGNWYAALQRDAFTCQSCGIRSFPSQWASSKKKRLVVHHRDGSGETKNKNHELENLITLCQPCHREFHNVFLIYVDGTYMVAGDQFGRLGIEEIKTCPSPHS